MTAQEDNFSTIQTMRILVVDECREICDVTSLHLRRRGFVADVAYDARSADTAIRSQRYDVVVADYFTEHGGPSGVPPLAWTARALNRQVRVIMTGSVPQDSTDLYGCEFLQKPFHPADLCALLPDLPAGSAGSGACLALA